MLIWRRGCPSTGPSAFFGVRDDLSVGSLVETESASGVQSFGLSGEMVRRENALAPGVGIEAD